MALSLLLVLELATSFILGNGEVFIF